MRRKLLTLITIISVLTATGCVKDTYNMDRLSKRAHLSPSFAISAVRGDISLSDLLEPGDTVIFESDSSVKIVFEKDSIIEFKLADYYDLNDMVSFHQTYQIGEIKLAPFTGSVYPLTTTGELPFSVFSNFENATLSQGVIDITVKNRTAAVINNITITLYNASPRQQIGNQAIITAINPGQNGTATINLANFTLVRNSLRAAFVISGGPGMVLNGSNLEIGITGRDMKVRSGRVVVPPQTVESLDGHDTILFDPGADVEISVIKMNAGNLSYSINSGSPLKSKVDLTLPTALRSGVPITMSLTVNPGFPLNGNISVDNSTVNLGTITTHPFNMAPVDYQVEISSDGSLINFNSADNIIIDFSLLNPDFDFVKGYFGQKTETLEPDTLDLEIKDILNHITGDFLLSSPKIRLNYSNSFSLPVLLDLQATGYRKTKTVNLGLDPDTLKYPAAPAQRDITAVFTIDKSNSSLPELVSMPPEKIRFAGTAKINPKGNTGARNNYLFGNSRFIGSLEIEVPLEFRINNLQFADTVDNFLKSENSGDSPLRPEDFEFLRIDIAAKNGFPLGVSLSMILYDSVTGKNKNTITANDILKPAAVDGSGKATTPADCATSIEITKDFWNSIDAADKIIFMFTLNSTENGSKDVRIYSGYKINFKAALVLKPDIRIDMN